MSARRRRPYILGAVRAVLSAACAAAVLCAIAANPAAAGPRIMTGDPTDVPPPPPKVIDKVGIDQRLDAQVPMDLVFRDEAGQPFRFSERLGQRPVLLVPVYYGCPSLCTMSLSELQRVLQSVDLDPGTHFDILTVSFDPSEGPELAQKKKTAYLKGYRRAGAEQGWRFLTGDQENIRRLMDSVGFRYAWDEPQKQFVHSSGLIVLTPQGRVSRYFFGVEYVPRDIKLSLMEASGNKIGGPANQVLLYCFKFNPATGKYTLHVQNALKVGAVLIVLALSAFIVRSARRDRRQRLTVPTESVPGAFEVVANDNRAAEAGPGDPPADRPPQT